MHETGRNSVVSHPGCCIFACQLAWLMASNVMSEHGHCKKTAKNSVMGENKSVKSA